MTPSDRQVAAAAVPAPDSTRPGGGKQKLDSSATPVAYWAEEQAPVLVLPANARLALDRLSLKPGQLVRGESGTRPQVLVPERGFSLAVEDVTFENIDFVAERVGGQRAAGGMIAVSASRAQFLGCTFRGDPAAPAQRAAIAWRGPAAGRRAAAEATGQIVLRGCVVAHVTSAVEVAGPTRFSLSLANSLFADCAAIVRLRRSAHLDPAGDLLIEHVTVRETGPVLFLDGESAADSGLLSVNAIESTFALREGRRWWSSTAKRRSNRSASGSNGRGKARWSPMPRRSPPGALPTAMCSRFQTNS